MIIQIAGFLVEAFPRVYFCVSCVIAFSFSIICVLFDPSHNRLSFRRFVVEVDLVFCFSILHNLLIYVEISTTTTLSDTLVEF